MPRITEPTIQERLWSWLDERGYTVAGEVALGDSGRIDLLAYDEEAETVAGIEIKNHDRIEKLAPYGVDGSKEDLRELALQDHWQQLYKYQSSGYLDKLYFASQEPESIFEVTDEAHTYASDAHDISPVPRLYAGSEHDPEDVGLIRLPAVREASVPTVVREARSMARTETPHLTRDDEPWVQHHVWDELGTLREGVLPNSGSNRPRRIDIVAFTGSSDPTEVYENQPEDDIVGVEAKGAGAVQSTATSITDQLHDYLNSGALTKVYLAVPHADRDEALELLTNGPDELDEVGLYTVETTGHVTRERSAARQTLRYDGIRTDEDQVVDILWGYERGEEDEDKVRYSVYDLSDGVMERSPF